MSPEQEAYLEQVPVSYRATFERAFNGQSRSAAVKAFCLMCVGFQRNHITNCTAKSCPLYEFRPYQSGAEEE